MREFTHFGKIGDLLYSLYFCKEFSNFLGEDKFKFNIHTNVKYDLTGLESNPNKNQVFLTTEDAQFIAPFLKVQSYIDSISIGDMLPQNNNLIDLNIFRQKDIISWMGVEIRDWYYICTNVVLPREFWKPIFFVKPNYKFKDKILFTLTKRYVNCNINFKELQPFKNTLVFLGLENQYEDFCQKYFEIEYAGKFNNLLEIAQILAGAKGYISNPNGLFAIAEGLKIRRGLIACDCIKINDEIYAGPTNVTPLGGFCNQIHDNNGLTNTLYML